MSLSQRPNDEKLSDVQQIDRLCSWIKQEIETISENYKKIHDGYLFSKKKYKQTIKNLLDQITVLTQDNSNTGPAETLKKVITTVNSEFYNLVKKYCEKEKILSEAKSATDSLYADYNKYLASKERKGKSHYPKMLSHLLLNIKKLAEDENTCHLVRGIISANISSDIKKIEKNPYNNYGLETFGQYLARALECEKNQKILNA